MLAVPAYSPFFPILSDRNPLTMVTALSTLVSSPTNSRFIRNQASSSASQVEKMVLREMRDGDFSHMRERIERIDQLLAGGLLESADERRLRLLAARFLEGAGDTRRALRLVGTLLSDRDTLHGEFYVELRRFRIRLYLNAGDVDSARWEIDRTERNVTETSGTLGEVNEVVDRVDTSRVSVSTWLLESEVCLAEDRQDAALECLAHALRGMKSGSTSIDETVMFELVSALAIFASGDDSGLPALAYLYRSHVEGSESSVEAAIKARISASVGKMEMLRGVSEAEALRWRRYGPAPVLLTSYLADSVGSVIPVDLSSRIPRLRLLKSDDVETLVASPGLAMSESQDFALDGVSFPMSFQFISHGLENVSGYFDFHLVTGPIVVDWSRCGRQFINEAIESEAITPLAAKYKRGIIYFNNGAYVDAVFEGAAGGEHKVEDVIYELFRISMAGLPGTFGVNPVAGPAAARDPEVVNYRPNQFNMDIMRRLDHAKMGDLLPEMEDQDIDRALASWGSGPSAQTVSVVKESVGLSDAEASEGVSFLSNLLRVTELETVDEIYRQTQSAVRDLGLAEAVVLIKVQGAGTSLVDGVSVPADYVVCAKANRAQIGIELNVPPAVDVSCKDSVQLLLNTALQRLRTVGTSVVTSQTIEQLPDFVAADPVTQTLLSTLREYALLDGINHPVVKPILLTGERGTGKELLARAIHRWSGRNGKMFLAKNLAALNRELATSLIFGARKGAYTGADKDTEGFIQACEGGTFFADELDEADGNIQAMFKRVIEYGTYNRVGAPEELKADVRFVAATNVMGFDNGIKADLRDRFLQVRVPPLRERRGDIRPLAETFALRWSGEDSLITLSEPALVFLEKLDWPGNVRQLLVVIERACVAVNGLEERVIDLDVIERAVVESHVVPMDTGTIGEYAPLVHGETLKMRRKKVDSFHVRQVLDECNWNVKHASDRLGMTRQGLSGLMKELEIVKPGTVR